MATVIDQTFGHGWALYQGDCIQVLPGIPDSSVDFCVHSPPFAQLYVYSDSEADMGNAGDEGEFFDHYAYLIQALLRVLVPGRAVAVHVKDLPYFINRDGVMGINPFSDKVTTAFLGARLPSEDGLPDKEKTRFVLQSRITVGKDPVIEMQKTNSHGLLYKNWKERAEMLRVGLPDYVLVFRKFTTENIKPVQHDPRDKTYFGDNSPGDGEWLTLPSRRTGVINTSLPVWQRYANPIWDDVQIPCVWQDIDQTDVLNYLLAKEDKDSRHICPLQLGLISRLVHWYTNPGEIVLDPFAGIGSSGYEALKINRRFVGVELKESYYHHAIRYLQDAEREASQMDLFQWAAQQQTAGA